MKEGIRSRLYESIETASKLANGKVTINFVGDKEIMMSEKYACPDCDFTLPELEPRIFSFNAPYGACPECKGLGIAKHVSEELLIPNPKLSIMDGAIKSFTFEDNIDTTKLAEYILDGHHDALDKAWMT